MFDKWIVLRIQRDFMCRIYLQFSLNTLALYRVHRLKLNRENILKNVHFVCNLRLKVIHVV